MYKLSAHAFIVHMLEMMLDNQMERENAITTKSLPPILQHYLVYLHDCEFFSIVKVPPQAIDVPRCLINQ